MAHRRLRRGSGLAALLTAGALVLAGCSGSSEPDDSQFTGPPVTIGIMAPTNSAITSRPGAIGGADAAAAAINKQGGLNGRKVETYYCNDKGDPNVASQCARDMASRNVIAVVGGAVNAERVAQPILQGAGIPMVGWNATIMFDAPNEYLFSGGTSYADLWSSAYIVHKGQKAVIVTNGTAEGTALAGLMSGVATQSGGQPFGVVTMPPNTSDMSTVVAAASQTGANAVICLIANQQCAQFIQAAEQGGGQFAEYYKPAPNPAFLDAIGNDTAGKVFNASAFPPVSSPQLQAFRDEMTAQQESGDDNADQANWDEVAVSSWLAVHTTARLLTGEANVSAQTLTAKLNTARDIDMQGIVPPWTPAAPGPTPNLARVSNSAAYLMHYPDGQAALVVQPPKPLADAVAGKF